MSWTYWLAFCQIETRPCVKAEHLNILAWFSLTQLTWCILPKDSLHLLYICLSTDSYKLLLTIRPKYISNWNSWSSYLKKLLTHWCILSTISPLHYSSSFLLHCLSPTPFQPVILTSVLAKPIREHLVHHSHCTTLGIRYPRCHCFTQYQIHRVMHNRLCCYLDHPSHHSNLACYYSPKCGQVRNPHHLRLDDGWYFGLAGHLIFEFVLQRCPLQTKLVAKEIFLTIQIQLHHHVEKETRLLWRSLPYAKCIYQLPSACSDPEIPSVQHACFCCPTTYPKRCGPSPICAIPFRPPLSSVPSSFLCWLYLTWGYCLP